MECVKSQFTPERGVGNPHSVHVFHTVFKRHFTCNLQQVSVLMTPLPRMQVANTVRLPALDHMVK